MNKSRIDWPYQPLYLWNPVTGCERGCSWCVVKNRVWPRIRHCYGGHDFNKVTFHPEQFNKPDNVKKPAYFFTGFYTDNVYWKISWWDQILDTVNYYKQHTFLFLTKNYYASENGWPENTMHGFTRTKYSGYEVLKSPVPFPHPFLSIEPLLGEMTAEPPDNIEKIIVGAMTGPDAIKPKPEWIRSVKDYCDSDKIYFKENIRRYL